MKKIQEENEKISSKLTLCQKDLERSKNCLKEFSQPLIMTNDIFIQNNESHEMPSEILDISEDYTSIAN